MSFALKKTYYQSVYTQIISRQRILMFVVH